MRTKAKKTTTTRIKTSAANPEFSNVPGLLAGIRRAQIHLIPPEESTPSTWAEKNINIPVGNAVPGPYRIHNAPYQREPMDMITVPGCYRVSLMWGAQVGKTLLALCVQGWAVAASPRSQMMMQPSEGDLEVWKETKWSPLAESSDPIANALTAGKINNKKMIGYPGGYMMFAWAGSPKTTRGRSAPLIVGDEVDGYLRTKEGHPVSLLWQRSATFGDLRFLIEISTPTVKGESFIDDAWRAGDMRHFFVPCPHCGEHVALSWDNVFWPGKGKNDEENAKLVTQYDESDACNHAALHCPECGAAWNDGERVAAIRRAESAGAGWKATRPFRGHASYHLNELYSTFRKISGIVRDYFDKLKADDLQAFYNVSLALPYDNGGEKADPESLRARVEEFTHEVPAGGLYITMGVDMQIDRLEAEVVAWGLGEESWSLGYHVMWGDPLTPDPWDQLDDLIASTYQHESGKILPISAICLDTGGSGQMTTSAYTYAAGRTGRRLFAIKGVPGWGRAIVEKSQSKTSGANKKKVTLFLVGTDEAKLVISRRLAKTEPGPGYCHIPDDRAESYPEWFDQVTNEKLVTKYVKGVAIKEWIKPDKARVEALDCRVYAYTALKITAPSLRRLAERLGVDTTTAPTEKRGKLGRVKKIMDKRPSDPATENDSPHIDEPAPKKQNRLVLDALNTGKKTKSSMSRRKKGKGWVTNF